MRPSCIFTVITMTGSTNVKTTVHRQINPEQWKVGWVDHLGGLP